jgi:hypothetical protein
METERRILGNAIKVALWDETIHSLSRGTKRCGQVAGVEGIVPYRGLGKKSTGASFFEAQSRSDFQGAFSSPTHSMSWNNPPSVTGHFLSIPISQTWVIENVTLVVRCLWEGREGI